MTGSINCGSHVPVSGRHAPVSDTTHSVACLLQRVSAGRSDPWQVWQRQAPPGGGRRAPAVPPGGGHARHVQAHQPLALPALPIPACSREQSSHLSHRHGNAVRVTATDTLVTATDSLRLPEEPEAFEIDSAYRSKLICRGHLRWRTAYLRRRFLLLLHCCSTVLLLHSPQILQEEAPSHHRRLLQSLGRSD